MKIAKICVRKKKTVDTDRLLSNFETQLRTQIEKIASYKRITGGSRVERQFFDMQGEANQRYIETGDENFIRLYEEFAEKYNQAVTATVEYKSKLERIGHEVRIPDDTELHNSYITNEKGEHPIGEGYRVEEVLNGKRGRERGEEKPYETEIHVEDDPRTGLVE